MIYIYGYYILLLVFVSEMINHSIFFDQQTGIFFNRIIVMLGRLQACKRFVCVYKILRFVLIRKNFKFYTQKIVTLRYMVEYTVQTPYDVYKVLHAIVCSIDVGEA